MEKGSHFSVTPTQLYTHLVQYILSSKVLLISPRVWSNQEEVFSTISSLIHCQRCYLVLALFHLVLGGRIIKRILQDVTVYLDGTTDINQAKEVGHAHPLFAAAVIRNISMVLMMSPLKSHSPRSQMCYNQGDWRDTSSQFIVTCRIFMAPTFHGSRQG